MRFLLVAAVYCLALLLPQTAGAQNDAEPDARLGNQDDEIVYIDAAGFIRVLDTQFGTGKQVQWVSPTGGWFDAALGDFNADGDMEIVTIKGDHDASRLTVFDPVVSSGPINLDQQFNGIYWDTLYDTSLPGTPDLVTTGKFNRGVPGQEIVVAFHKAPGMAAGDTRLQVRILTDPSTTPNGRTWQTFAEMTNSEFWTDVATGDLDLNGLDELALIDEEASQLSIYRMQGNELVRFFANTSESKHWTDVAIGPVDPSTALPELVIVRSADPPLPSLTVWRYNGNNGFVDVYLADFAPSMRVVFLADVTGDGDQEIYMLRDVPVALTTIPQLVMRNLGPPGPVPFEVRLDPNNIFRYGAGGDLDGDGKDEIAVISTAQLRIWDSPDTSTTSRNESVSSNGRTILIGNLDAIGAVKEDRLNAAPPRIDRSLAAGTRSEPISIFLTNSTTSNPISFTVTAAPLTPLVTWATTAVQTPAELLLTIDARDFLPGGVYGTNLIVTAVRKNVANTPLAIPLVVNISDGIVVRPIDSTIFMVPCPKPDAAVQTVTLQILGAAGSTFAASVVPQGSAALPATPENLDDWPRSVSWITSASSPTTTVPSVIVMTIDPNQAPDLAQAVVHVSGLVNGASAPRTANLALTCLQNAVYLPMVTR